MVSFKRKVFFYQCRENGEKVQKGQNHPQDFADINLVEWRAQAAAHNQAAKRLNIARSVVRTRART